MKIDLDVQGIVHAVMDLLVRRDYSALMKLTAGVRLSDADIEGAVKEYGRELVMPPSEGYQLMNATPIKTQTGGWSIAMPLWTAEEGRSDLTLELTIAPTAEGYRVEIDDLHVL
jgi:hypothetical protein